MPRTRTKLFGTGKLKIVLIASTCLFLGWLISSSLAPGEDESGWRTAHEIGSAGVLGDPSGYGLHYEDKKRPGIIGNEPDSELKQTRKKKPNKPSVSGALKDLHHAVTDKIQSWKPYSARPNHDLDVTNTTADAKKLLENTTALAEGEIVKEGNLDDARLGARTRIGKCTILFRGNGFWERCIRTHEQHDKRHGYRLHVLRQELLDDVWSKPAYILSLLLRELAKPESERLEWLLWVDSDTIILNPHIPIETFLPPPGTEFDDIYMMYTADWNGLNNGVFPIRVNRWAVNLLSSVVAWRHFNPDDPLQFRDQSAMNSLIQQPKYAKHMVQAPQRWFNAYQGEHNETLAPFQIRRGDLLVHFAGVPDREPRMQYWLERAEQHLDDWEIPVKSTSYPQEAKDFWNEQRALRREKEAQISATTEIANKLLASTAQRMIEYADRLTEEQRSKIAKQQEEFMHNLGNDDFKTDKQKIEDGTKALLEAAQPLTDTIVEANKALLQAAHAAIFGGEKDLLDFEAERPALALELDLISNAVKRLKNLVMSPEDFWNRNDITTATNAVTEARASLHEKAAGRLAAEKEAAMRYMDRVKTSTAAAGAEGGAATIPAIADIELPKSVATTNLAVAALPPLATATVLDAAKALAAAGHIPIAAPNPSAAVGVAAVVAAPSDLAAAAAPPQLEPFTIPTTTALLPDLAAGKDTAAAAEGGMNVVSGATAWQTVVVPAVATAVVAVGGGSLGGSVAELLPGR